MKSCKTMTDLLSSSEKKYFLWVPCLSVISRRQFLPVVGAFGEPRLQWGIGRRVVSHSDFLFVHVVKKGMCDKTPRTQMREARWREVKKLKKTETGKWGKSEGRGGLGLSHVPHRRGKRGFLREIWVELCHPGLQTWPCFIWAKTIDCTTLLVPHM